MPCRYTDSHERSHAMDRTFVIGTHIDIRFVIGTARHTPHSLLATRATEHDGP